MSTQFEKPPVRSTNVVSLLEYKARRELGTRGAAAGVPGAQRAAWLLPTPRQVTHWRQMLTHLTATDAPS